MSAAVSLTLSEYLSTEYEPDCEYIDGVLEDRNVGKRKHSKTQTLLTTWLASREQLRGYDVLVEQRIRLSPSRVRIPDICLVSRDDADEVIQRPPALWVEILSPEDRWSRIQAKLADILRFGTTTIWIIDPYSKQAWTATHDKPVTEVQDSVLRLSEPAIEVRLDEVLPQD